MTSTQTDLINGVTTSVAVKAPVRAVATTNITLSGLQTVGGVVLAENDRVLCVAQDDATENGIYPASSGAWARAKDFDGNRDVVQFTLIPVDFTLGAGAFYQVTSPNPITIGTTELTFALHDPNLTFPETDAEDTASASVADFSKWGDEEGVINVQRFGAGAGATAVENLAHLQTAIAVADAAGHGSRVRVTPDAEFDWDQYDDTTWPDFTGTESDMLVEDSTEGVTPFAAPVRNGMQLRYWTNTPNTNPVGQHNGNGWLWLGDWNPYLMAANISDLSGARTVNDNRRCGYYLGRRVDGELTATWRFGMSTLTSDTATDDELSAVTIEAIGGFAGEDQIKSMFVGHLDTGNTSWHTYSNSQLANYHFKSPIIGYTHMLLESLSQTCDFVLRGSDGSGDDVTIRNNNGILQLILPAGALFESTQATRFFGIGVSPVYKLDVQDSRDSEYVVQFTNASATDGSVIAARTASVAGTGHDLFTGTVDYDGTPNIVFSLRGDGEGLCEAAWTGGGADHAEFFEWDDGNPNAEDRRGVTVVIVNGDKIRPAQVGEQPFGVISVKPTTVGNAAPLSWHKKFVKDDFGDFVTETVEVVTWEETIITQAFEAAKPAVLGEPEVVYHKRGKKKGQPKLRKDGSVRTRRPVVEISKPEKHERQEIKKHSYFVDRIPPRVVVPANAERSQVERQILNPQFNKAEKYVPRAERKEWGMVGFVGRLRVLAGQPVASQWIKLRDISPQITEYFVRS